MYDSIRSDNPFLVYLFIILKNIGSSEVKGDCRGYEWPTRGQKGKVYEGESCGEGTAGVPAVPQDGSIIKKAASLGRTDDAY